VDFHYQSRKVSVMYICVVSIFPDFYNYSIRFCNCSNSVLLFVFHFILEDEAYFTRYQSRHVNVGLLNTTTVRNSLKCALICLQHFTCTGFNYQEITGSCQLTKATLTDLISNNEWDHYLECA
jgi:hypothetical protein